MTREEAIKNIKAHCYFANLIPQAKEALDVAIKALEQEPCADIAQERYKDLCEYFGGAKDILKSREDFKAWLGRVKWHIRKAEELYEKYEYKQEPCTDAISRQAVLDEIFGSRKNFNNEFDQGFFADKIRALPPVTPQQKTGHWINIDATHSQCDRCGAVFEIVSANGEANYCPNCGAKMQEEEE